MTRKQSSLNGRQRTSESTESSRRIAVSLSSANEFFDREPVSAIDEGRIEAYKAWRFNEHDVRHHRAP
jgi:hypothetical protein